MKTIHDGLNRLRAEYLEMPGLRLQRAQVERLCGIERALCEQVLEALVAERFLYRTSDGHYVRLTDGYVISSTLAKAVVAETRGRFMGKAS